MSSDGTSESKGENGTMRPNTGERIWVTVLVERGFVSEIEAYRDEASACGRERSWRRQMNPDYDETGLCDVIINESRIKQRSHWSRSGARDTRLRVSRLPTTRSGP
jgi:hypothetical protein